MSSRMDKYKNEQSEDVVPTRSNKNKELYKQIYNAYDSFENLIVPSNAREIKPSELKEEITSRDEYRQRREYEDISGNKTNNTVIRKEKMLEEQRKEEEVYDINELLNKAVSEKKENSEVIQTLTNEEYLKRLKIDNRQMNLEKIREQYEEEPEEEDESLMKTANLSLEILSDLKGDNDQTVVHPPIKSDEMPEADSDFYSNEFTFSKKDFINKKESNDEEIMDDMEEESTGNGKFFFKVFIIILGVLLLGLLLFGVFNILNKA